MKRLRGGSTGALLLLSLSLGSCKRVEEPAVDEPSARPAPSLSATGTNADGTAGAARALPGVAGSHLVAPTQLLTLQSSAYQAGLFADDQAIEVLTSSAAYRLLPGKEVQTRPIDLSFAATVTRSSYVYWSRGALLSEPRRGANSFGPTQLARLAEQPQRIVADLRADEFAWVTNSEGHQQAIATLQGKRVKILYTSPGSVDALTMIGDALYFVERRSAEGYRIGRVKLSGGDPLFASDKSGRWPAFLRGVEEVVYYDGARRNVLGLSLDLQRERTLASDFICSPMAVGEHVFCSTMEGVFELSATGQPRRVVPASRQLIANLAATSEQLAFITDIGGQGQDQLAVYSVPLKAQSAGEPMR